MIKKIIQIADYHVRTYKRHEEYIEQTEKFSNQIKELLSDYDRDEVRLAIIGDIVHQKISVSNEQFRYLAWFFRLCADLYPTILVAGNHDMLEHNKDRLDSLTPIIELLNHKDLHYLTESKCYLDDNIVWCNYSIFEENLRPVDLESFKEKYDDTKKFIGLYHGPLIGSKTDLGFEVKGNDLTQFEGLEFCLLGDIHSRQKLEYNGIPLVYPGSLIQQDYGEKIHGHGFLVWDVETGTYEEHDIDSDYGFYQFKVNSLDDIETNNEELTNG